MIPGLGNGCRFESCLDYQKSEMEAGAARRHNTDLESEKRALTMKTKCGTVGTMCPTVYKTERGTYIIVGKRIDHTQHAEIKNRVAEDEAAVEIDAELLENIVFGESR